MRRTGRSVRRRVHRSGGRVVSRGRLRARMQLAQERWREGQLGKRARCIGTCDLDPYTTVSPGIEEAERV